MKPTAPSPIPSANPITGPFAGLKTRIPNASPARAANPFDARNAMGETRRPRPAESSLS